MLLSGHRVPDRLDHALDETADVDACGSRFAVDLHLDGRERGRQTMRADAREDLEERAAVLTALQRLDRSPLLGGGALVDDQSASPVPLVDCSGPRVQTGEADALEA